MTRKKLDHDELVPIYQVAAEWHRSASELYSEIERHDYREEQGVFFRQEGRRAWRINRFQYLWWRQLPLAAVGDARVKQFTGFLLQHLKPLKVAIAQAERFLEAENEAAAVRLEQPTNHSDPEVKP